VLLGWDAASDAAPVGTSPPALHPLPASGRIGVYISIVVVV